MSIKKKLGLGIASAALGLSLVGGGTFAYFSATTQATAEFQAGTLKLSAHPTEIINIKNIKPGDWMQRTFNLQNDGSLDIHTINLATNYSTGGAVDQFGKNLGDYIQVEVLYHGQPANSMPIYLSTLSELRSMSPEILHETLSGHVPTADLKKGETHPFIVKFKFLDNGADQNAFQGEWLRLEWTFNAKQGTGVEL
ncbi:TasA family protein [Bacillus sp. OK048]|uniref:TasA family protein n=1 Tax=Bacillus sp. OK048 TaxID=1882761 RepID=UPI000884EA9F|nr:TasA family protein [Bacillus sp. OK048]SDL91133.1 spore coat-associated protein N [Bacillus sp. OK048]